MHESEKWKWSCSVLSDYQPPHGLQPTRLLCPRDSPGRSTGVGCHCLLCSLLTLPKISPNIHCILTELSTCLWVLLTLQEWVWEKKAFSSVQSLSRVRFFVTALTAALQASLFITNSQSLLKLMSIELVMPSNHLILCYPLLLLPSIFPSIRVFSNKSALCIRWPKD